MSMESINVHELPLVQTDSTTSADIVRLERCARERLRWAEEALQPLKDFIRLLELAAKLGDAELRELAPRFALIVGHVMSNGTEDSTYFNVNENDMPF